MRVLAVTAALCLLTACSSTPTRAPVAEQAPAPAKPADALSEARAQNRHWLEPGLASAFPAGQDANYRPPGKLAVLLPQSGALAQAGTAIRDGLLAGYYAETRSRPGIRFYDTQGSADGAVAAYQRAQKDGAQMVIGPISKDEVAAVAAVANGLPVLALNKLDDPKNRYVLNFSLNPEREGELIAERLLARNLLSAGVFSQGGDGSSRSLAAFERRYRQGGGQLVFKAPTPPFGKDETGAAIVPSLPDTLPQAKALVLLMSGTSAKPTRAALALNGAGALPVFAGSDITDNAESATNLQLDGIEFPQMPWLLGRGNAQNVSAAQLGRLPSARGPGARLNGFGLDAWLVATRLSAWLDNPNAAVDGATGKLHLEPDGEIERQLPWWTFRNGTVQAANGQ